jgi:hypothetical protein
MLFDSAFLQEGHMGLGSPSFFAVGDAESAGRADAGGSENATGTRLFNLHSHRQVCVVADSESETHERGCGGFPLRHVVCSLMSLSERGGPVLV